jgi:hypothetical protein
MTTQGLCCAARPLILRELAGLLRLRALPERMTLGFGLDGREPNADPLRLREPNAASQGLTTWPANGEEVMMVPGEAAGEGRGLSLRNKG